MKVESYAYEVFAEVVFTADEVKMMVRLSHNHYDGECRRVSSPGGFLYGLMNHTVWGEASTAVTPYKLSFRQLDTLCKILEQSRTGDQADLYMAVRTELKKLAEKQKEALEWS